MTSEIGVELIKQIFELLKAIIWPLVALLIIFKFRQGFSDFFRRLSELNFKTAAGEVSMKTTQAAALISAASVSTSRNNDGDVNTSVPADAADVETISRNIETATRDVRRLRFKRILWVDDIPKNNQFEIKAFETLGIEVDTALSTDDGLAMLQVGRYDMAITDLTRKGETSAGLKFIQRARTLMPALPILVYSSARGAHQYDEAKRLGAFGATYKPDELFNLAMKGLDN